MNAWAATLIGAAAGAAGAILMWVMLGQLSISGVIVAALVTWLITAVGWYRSARLSEQAQRRMLRHNLLNTARAEVVKATRLAQEWAGTVGGLGFRFRAAWELRLMDQQRTPEDDRRFWLEQNRLGRETLFGGAHAVPDLMIVLEEYEVLFPQTRHVRAQLGHFSNQQIVQVYTDLLTDLMHPNIANVERAIAGMEARHGSTMDLQAVLMDLQIWIQNAALSEIVGGTVPPRQPLDPTVPIMAPRADGQLEIAAVGHPWPVPEFP